MTGGGVKCSVPCMVAQAAATLGERRYVRCSGNKATTGHGRRGNRAAIAALFQNRARTIRPRRCVPGYTRAAAARAAAGLPHARSRGDRAPARLPLARSEAARTADPGAAISTRDCRGAASSLSLLLESYALRQLLGLGRCLGPAHRWCPPLPSQAQHALKTRRLALAVGTAYRHRRHAALHPPRRFRRHLAHRRTTIA